MQALYNLSKTEATMAQRRSAAVSAKRAPGSYVALLRGINVAGKNLLPMKNLCAIFVAAGCRDVRNYIQSGNIVFKAEPRFAAEMPALIARDIAREFGLDVPVVLRSAVRMMRSATSAVQPVW